MAEPEFLVVGLGNPGPEYEFTPHNLGFLTVDRLAERAGTRLTRLECRALCVNAVLSGKPALLAKPQTYMNLSGQAVKGLSEKYGIPPPRIVVVYDELDLPWGGMRIRPKGSASGHNGMQDVIRCLGTEDITRLRLGIHPGHPIKDGAKFVLAPLKSAQKQELDELLDQACSAVESIFAVGVDKAMTMHNRRAQGAKEES